MYLKLFHVKSTWLMVTILSAFMAANTLIAHTTILKLFENKIRHLNTNKNLLIKQTKQSEKKHRLLPKLQHRFLYLKSLQNQLNLHNLISKQFFANRLKKLANIYNVKISNLYILKTTKMTFDLEGEFYAMTKFIYSMLTFPIKLETWQYKDNSKIIINFIGDSND